MMSRARVVEIAGAHADTRGFVAVGLVGDSEGDRFALDASLEAMNAITRVGAKHSSLSRTAEWDRLAGRGRARLDFRVFSGNDLAIDIVCYGSDYLLGLSAFVPEAFSERDRRWYKCDRAFHELNDVLQYVGSFTFRPPCPAYRHDVGIFLSGRGRIDTDATPSGAPRRPKTDRAVLADIAARSEAML
jgi:hypothetical protein